MTIGEAADAVGVSAKAIRLWETRGLVPGVERTPAGYRLFGEDELAILRFIRQAQTLGMTLGEIGSVLDLQHGGGPCAKVRETLDTRIAEIDHVIADLQRLRQSLTATRRRADEAGYGTVGDSGVCPIIEQLAEDSALPQRQWGFPTG